MARIAFDRSPAFAERTAPPIPTPEEYAARYPLDGSRPTLGDEPAGPMTVDDVLARTGLSFLVLLAGAGVGWFAPFLLLPAMLAGLVLALVNIFRRTPSPGLILAYAAAQGALVGAASNVYSSLDGGLVPMALLGAVGVVGATLALFVSGKVRASARATKIFLVALVGYLAYSLVNVGLVWFGVTDSMYGLSGDITILGIPLGVILGVVAILMGAYSLVLDFDFVQQGVQNGAPKEYSWTAAFSITMTAVWLYLEMLRLLSFFSPAQE